MKPPVIFLNELSCRFEAIEAKDVTLHILKSVNALQTANAIRDDLVLGSSIPLPNLTFGSAQHTLASALSNHRLEMRYLMALARANPWPAVISSTAPGLTSEIRCQGGIGFGLTWADKEETLTVSFGHAPWCAKQEIAAERYSIDLNGNEMVSSVNVPNISDQDHVGRWRNLLENYGFQESVSSVIYRADGFLIRMFLNDHEPPHIHIQPPDGMRTLGKMRIDNFEMLDRDLPADIKKSVIAWTSTNQKGLLQSWARCRAGNLPLSFGE